MKILYIGDIMAEPGQKAVGQALPELKKGLGIDFVIAQAENMNSEGKGPGKSDVEAMQVAGVDFFTGGNHSLTGKGSAELYSDEVAPIIRPANLVTNQGKGWQIINTSFGSVLIVSLMGQTVGRPTEISNPLSCIDQILEEVSKEKIVASIVNLHGDFSSEKVVFGYYLDGRVSAVIGDHWHVPTADAMVYPKGTAHITDVGMCGILHSSLGVKTDVIIERWKTGHSSKNLIEENGQLQFNALLVDVDTNTGLSNSVELVQKVLN